MPVVQDRGIVRRGAAAPRRIHDDRDVTDAEVP
jgi:hypothetical protein